ncbi:MAG: TetR/AcrR family transcriptional regulator [Streptosporangiaceae bacterium]|jgi:AcrR family transcriptional regulator
MAGPGPDPRLSALVPIWDLPERGERGPKPKYSRAEIAAAAVRLADAEGLAAVTMRRIAAELRMGTMSLYSYVPAKEHLVQLMIDEAAREYVYPLDLPRDRQLAIIDLARQGRDIAVRHSWLPAVMHRPPAIGPHAMRYVDYFLGLLGDSALDTGAKMELLALVNGFAIMYGGMQAAMAEERKRTGVTEQEQAAVQVRALVAAAASGAYPHLAAAMAAPSPARDADDIFESSLMFLVDGALAR